MLNYGEPQISKVFKNTLPSWIYWVLFTIDNLHVAVDTTKRILTRDRLDRQLAGQCSGVTPLMSLKEVKESKQNTATFSEESVINDKIDKLSSLIEKLAIWVTQNRQLISFKHRVYQDGSRPLNDFSWANGKYNEGNRSYAKNDQNFRGQNTFRVGTSDNCCLTIALIMFQPVATSKDFKHFITAHCIFSKLTILKYTS